MASGDECVSSVGVCDDRREECGGGDECVLGVCNGRRGVCCCLKIIVWLLRA